MKSKTDSSTAAESVARKPSRFPQHPFLALVDRKGPDECWMWLGGLGKGGYGVFRFSLGGRRTWGAHRVSLEMSIGQLREGECACHRCDTPSCVNPGHLFVGSPGDNNADRHAKGRSSNSLTGRWRELAAKAGGIAGLARLLGVERSTISFWHASRWDVPPMTARSISEVARSLGVESPVEPGSSTSNLPRGSGGRPTVATGPWAALIAAGGGVASLAAMIGASRSAVLKWAKGSPVARDTSAIAIRSTAAQLGVTSPV